MRRPNGSGCIRKLSGKRRKPYGAFITKGWEDGKQVQVFLGAFAKRSDAENHLNQYAGGIPDSINSTMEQMYDRWIKGKLNIVKSTADCYSAAWKWMDALHKKKVREVTPQDLQGCVDAITKAGRKRDTSENLRTVAHGIFKLAMKEGICNKDPADYMELPAAQKVVKTIFTDAEIDKIKAQSGNKWADSILVMIYSGMRVSEMLGLTGANIDLENKKIVGAGIKSDAGKEREIPIHNEILPIISNAIKGKDEYLFSVTPKIMVKDDNYRDRYFYPFLEKLGINHTPHECRHTTASLLVRSNVLPELAKYILGHEDYTTTMNIYNHPRDEELLSAINKI